MIKRLSTLCLAMLVLTGCGASPSALGGMVAPGGFEAAGAKKKAPGEAAIAKQLAAAQQRFLTSAQQSGKRQGLGDDSASYAEMAAAMTEMAALHDRMATLKGAQTDELSRAEALLYADVADLERDALAGGQKKGALGRLRDAFWDVVNKLATKPTQYYFNHPKQAKGPQPPKLPRFGDAELAQILKVARPGDVILWGGQSTFVHGSLYMGDGEIIHALANNTPAGPDAQGVFRETIKGYMARCERNRVAVLRVKGFDANDDQATMAYAVKQLGKPYDNVFRTGDEAAFYCTELVFHALEKAPHAPAIGSRKKVMGLFSVVTTDDIRLSPDLETLWSKNTPDPVPAAN